MAEKGTGRDRGKRDKVFQKLSVSSGRGVNEEVTTFVREWEKRLENRARKPDRSKPQGSGLEKIAAGLVPLRTLGAERAIGGM